MKTYSLVAVLLATSLSAQAETPVSPNATNPKYDVSLDVSLNEKKLDAPLNNEKYTYDDTLIRDSRVVNVKIFKNKRGFFGVKRPVLLNALSVSGIVATTKYNDNPNAFTVPIVATTEHSYVSKISEDKSEVTPATVTSGFSCFITLSDASPQYVGSMNVTLKALKGFVKVDEKTYNTHGSGSIYNAPMVDEENLNVVLKEGFNVQNVGEYTIVSDVSPIKKPAVANL